MEKHSASVVGPDPDGKYWITLEAGEIRASISVRSTGIVGQVMAAFTGQPALVPPPAAKPAGGDALLDNLQRVMDRAEHAPGKWREGFGAGGSVAFGDLERIDEIGKLGHRRDALLAIAAVNSLRELIDRIRRADQELQRLEGVIRQLEERWDREVLGLNNEGDPIGGEPAGGMQNEIERMRRQLYTIQLADSRRNRVYLAGPMTGYPEFNFPAFNAEAARLRATGLDVVNPAEHGIVEGAEWGDYLRYDIAKLANCEAIHFLPGWQASKGAQLEHSVAKALGMPMTFAEGAQQELDNQQTAAVRDVLAERRRQVEREGWTQEHDDEHDAGELAAAASAYALYASDELNPHSQGDGDYGRKEPDMWPLEASGWKPSNPRRALTKAGALILAEIERWDRMVAGITTHTDEQDGVKCIVTAKHNDNGTTEVLDVSFDEARMDVIGQNGPTGEHYTELAELAIQQGGKPVDELPDGLTWDQAPEWAKNLGESAISKQKFWFDDERYQYVSGGGIGPWKFGDTNNFDRNRDDVVLLATRPAPAASQEWIEHGPSKPCPLHNPYTSKVDVRLRDGTERLGDLACNFSWFWYEHDHRAYDVVAYRAAAPRRDATQA